MVFRFALGEIGGGGEGNNDGTGTGNPTGDGGGTSDGFRTGNLISVENKDNPIAEDCLSLAVSELAGNEGNGGIGG